MQNVIKHSVLVVLAAIALALFGGYWVAKAQPSSINVQTTAAATTTVAYIGVGLATSTYQIDSYPVYNSNKVFSMAGIDSVYLNLQGAASSTATVFGITVQVSDNGIDWYTYASPVIAGGTATTVLATTTYVWTPGTTATSSMSFKLPDVTGMHERVLISATGAAGAVYGEVVLKKNAQGQ